MIDFFKNLKQQSEFRKISSFSSMKTAVDESPTSIVLSWHSIGVKAENRSIQDTIKDLMSSRKLSKSYHTILEDLNGYVRPGELLALMGPSGSGKTSLLNALNFSGSKNLSVSGSIKINGLEADALRMAMVSRFIEQEDLFYGALTVKEHLLFHAMLRMGQIITEKTKLRRVDHVLREFNLEKSADVQIGIVGKIRGISGGEKKRLSFATEILTDPPLLFCDEPTSGLDSHMAKSTIMYLKKMANQGKTIVCTIHQPSGEIYKQFDKVCILSEKRLAYFGTGLNAVDFFTKNLCKEYPEMSSPPEFFLDTLSVNANELKTSQERIRTYCDIYAKSSYNKQLIDTIQQISSNNVFAVSTQNALTYKSSSRDQIYYLLRRNWLAYFNNYKVFLIDLFMITTVAVLGGLIYYKSGITLPDGSCTFNQGSLQNISFAIFYSLFVTSVFNILSAITVFPLEIPIYLKEHSAAVYRSDTFYLSKILIEIPLNIFFAVIYSIIIFNMVNFGCTKQQLFLFIFVEILTALASFSLGHLISVLSEDINAAITMATGVLATQFLFSGFFLNKAKNTPEWLRFLRHISIFDYSYDLLMILQWEGVKGIKCEHDLELLCAVSGLNILESESIDPSSKWIDMTMLIVLAIVYRILTYVILWFKGRRTPFKLDHKLRGILNV